jgi:outer membrane immunogenic protein
MPNRTRRFTIAALSVSILATIAISAFAADMPREPYSQPARAGQAPAPIFDWSGFYLSGFAGHGWKDSSAATAALPAPFPPFSLSANGNGQGWLYGVEISALRQVPGTNGVFGVAADWTFGKLEGGSPITLHGCGGCPAAIGGSAYSHEIDGHGTGRAVAGLAFGRWLVAVTGGVAFARGEATATFGGTSVTARANHVGWTAGAIAKYAFTENLIFGVDYLYADFGDADYGFGVFGPVDVKASAGKKTHTLRGSLGWRF